MLRFSGQNLSCLRGHVLVFENLSFALTQGQLLALTGPNGSGKTSLLRLMAGLQAPAKGEITWEDSSTDSAPNLSLHWIGPENALKPALTVVENLEFWRSADAGTEALATALGKLNLVSLANTPVRHLSAGQKRRAALARILLAERPLWLLDEPATNLDDHNAAMLGGLIKEHTARGGMAVIATHQPAFWTPHAVLSLAGRRP